MHKEPPWKPRKSFIRFRDKDGNLVLWYDRDRFNIFGRHNPHEEYRNTDAIRDCIANPDEIRQDAVNPRRLCFYRSYLAPDGFSVTMKCVIGNTIGIRVLITVYNARPREVEIIIWKKT